MLQSVDRDLWRILSFHVICCFRKPLVSLLVPFWELPVLVLMHNPWRGCAGNWSGGWSGSPQQTGLAQYVGLRGHPASPRRAYFPSLRGALEKDVGCRAGGGGWSEEETEEWILSLQIQKDTWLLLCLPIMRWEGADPAFSALDNAGFLKLRNIIYKKRMTFQEPLI